jgi:hypothetical protein
MSNIIPPFPSQIVPNTLADATQVQTLLNWIRDNVNANANPSGPSVGFGNVVGDLGGVNVTLSSTAAQLITLTNIQSDPLSEYAAGLYTASQPGLYVCTWQWNPTTGGGGVLCTSYIVVNGTPLSPRAVVSTPVGGGIMLLTKSINLIAGDTVSFYAQRNGTANSVDGTVYFTFGSVVRVQ